MEGSKGPCSAPPSTCAAAIHLPWSPASFRRVIAQPGARRYAYTRVFDPKTLKIILIITPHPKLTNIPRGMRNVLTFLVFSKCEP